MIMEQFDCECCCDRKAAGMAPHPRLGAIHICAECAKLLGIPLA